MKTTTNTLIIWERTAYCHAGDKGWVRVPFERPDDIVTVVQEYYKKNSRILVLYDPDVMQTEFSECPPGGRSIIKEALASTHEVISNIHTAWGIQVPWQLAGSGGTQGTFCSYETVPTLYPLITTLREVGYIVDNAYPFASLGAQMGESQGRTRIFLAVDKASQAYVYLHTLTGIRAARKLYAGKRQGDYDVWSEISMVLGEYGVTFDDGGQRPQVRIYQAPGTNMKTDCPYWNVLETQAQTEVYNFDSLALLAKSLQSRHPSSLVTDMPKYADLSFGFKVACGVLAAVILGFGIYTLINLSKERREIRSLQTQDSGFAAQEAKLQRNKTEIENLDRLYSQDIFELSDGRIRLLETLPAAIPREATLTQVNIGSGGGADFRIAGVFWNWKAVSQRGKNTLGAASTMATPFTAIKSNLESSIRGLLIPPATNQIQATGDFIIQGTTPQPVGAQQASAQANASQAAAGKQAKGVKR